MKIVRYVCLALTALILVGGAAAAVTLSGPQHMACPSCHDLNQIAPNVFVERTFSKPQQVKMLSDIDVARKRTARFFGALKSDPRIIICRSPRCAAIFGSKGAKGVAYGWMAILLRPSRIFATIATHELVHIELHWRMGLSGWLRGTVPVWFDEGLAVVVSEDPRMTRDLGARAVTDIMQVKSYLGAWNMHARRVGWRNAYGAAATRVRQMRRTLGPKQFKEFVSQLVRNGDPEGLLQRMRAARRRL